MAQEDQSRVVCWFSCGAASAVAAKLAVDKYGDRAVVVYCDTMASEHPDNKRFMVDVERWIGKLVTVISSTKYKDVDDVFMKTRYMAGIKGATCTTQMKKIPRFDFQLPDDIHVFGFTAEEDKRIRRFELTMPEMNFEWPLRDMGYTKERCFMELRDAHIPLPAMYGLGFKNNNCIGCVKASSPAYWNKVREHFPEVFEKRCQQSRELGARLVRIDGQRAFLDELPIMNNEEITEDLSCGPQCSVPDETYEGLIF